MKKHWKSILLIFISILFITYLFYIIKDYEFGVKKFFNGSINNWDDIAPIMSFLSLLATLLIILITLKNNKRLLNEMKKDRHGLVKPFLSAVNKTLNPIISLAKDEIVIRGDWISDFEIVLENIGSGPAINVKYYMEYDSEIINDRLNAMLQELNHINERKNKSTIKKLLKVIQDRYHLVSSLFEANQFDKKIKDASIIKSTQNYTTGVPLVIVYYAYVKLLYDQVYHTDVIDENSSVLFRCNVFFENIYHERFKTTIGFCLSIFSDTDIVGSVSKCNLKSNEKSEFRFGTVFLKTV